MSGDGGIGAAQLQKCSELDLCPQCLATLLSPRNEAILLVPTSKVTESNLAVAARLLGLKPDDRMQNPIYQRLRSHADGFESGTLAPSAPPVCPCCFGALSSGALEALALRAIELAAQYGGPTLPLCLEVVCPAIVDAMRITVRTVVTRSFDKTFPFPTVDQLVLRSLTGKLAGRLTVVVPGQAKAQVMLRAQVDFQGAYCAALWPGFREKRNKRKFQSGTSEEEGELSRKSVDSLLSQCKTQGSSGISALEASLKSYMQVVNGPSEPKSEPSSVLMLVSVSASAPASALVSASEPTSAVPEEREGYRVRWVASSVACPVYLLGRYRKLARDVPQAAWTVSTNAAAGDGEDRDRDIEEGGDRGDRGDIGDRDGDERDESNNKNSNSNSNNKDFNSRSSKTADPSREIRYERKGRCSVEEIVSHALQTYLPADAVRLHPCGREDINVRCLGNGRPFALEVLNPSILYPSLSLLQSVVRMVNSGQGLNQDRDVELALLAPAGKSLWEEMQTKAEEKRKGYRCVVWSEKAVTQSQLRELERLCSSGQTRDAEGDACIELTQKTPLRVLHRRSLLDRIRYVYDLQCVQINQHWFVMDIVTSAGTYVKEFVHGDLGRTLPSVSSVLQCHCDIQQLDVTWLYDDLEGSDPAQLIDADADASVATDTVITGAETTTLSWDALKAIKFAGLGSRSGTAKQEQ